MQRNPRNFPGTSAAGGASGGRREAQQGILRIFCDHANLPRARTPPDTFMRVRIGPHDKRTKVISRNLNPQWQESLELRGL